MAARTELDWVIDEATLSCGYQSLKDQQRQVVHSFLQGRDVFVCFPTGFGKSACFMILPSAFDILRKQAPGHSIVIVLSPLTSLMKDQVRSCREKGIRAAAIMHEDKSCEEDFKYQLVYISPEMLLGTKRWRSILDSNICQSRLVGIVVDEAHCVKTW